MGSQIIQPIDFVVCSETKLIVTRMKPLIVNTKFAYFGDYLIITRKQFH